MPFILQSEELHFAKITEVIPLDLFHIQVILQHFRNFLSFGDSYYGKVKPPSFQFALPNF
jgi:hypothetical protein